MGSVAVNRGTEVGGIDTAGDTIFCSPEDRLVEVVRRLNILKGIVSGLRLWRTGSSPQEGDDSGAVTVGEKFYCEMCQL